MSVTYEIVKVLKCAIACHFRRIAMLGEWELRQLELHCLTDRMNTTPQIMSKHPLISARLDSCSIRQVYWVIASCLFNKQSAMTKKRKVYTLKLSGKKIPFRQKNKNKNNSMWLLIILKVTGLLQKAMQICSVKVWAGVKMRLTYMNLFSVIRSASVVLCQRNSVKFLKDCQNFSIEKACVANSSTNKQ